MTKSNVLKPLGNFIIDIGSGIESWKQAETQGHEELTPLTTKPHSTQALLTTAECQVAYANLLLDSECLGMMADDASQVIQCGLLLDRGLALYTGLQFAHTSCPQTADRAESVSIDLVIKEYLIPLLAVLLASLKNGCDEALKYIPANYDQTLLKIKGTDPRETLRALYQEASIS